MTANVIKTTSGRFCAADSDITFESSDHVLFHVHRSNVKTHSKVIPLSSEAYVSPEAAQLSQRTELLDQPPPQDMPSSNEIVQLTETADVLDVLFQHMYPEKPPDLRKIPFKIFAGVADAAEKYRVYGVIALYSLFMALAYQDHPFEVLVYATRHGYPELMDLAQKRALELSPEDAFHCLPPPAYIAWTRYQAQFTDVLGFAVRYQIDRLSQGYRCSTHYLLVKGISDQLAAGSGASAVLLDLDTLFRPLAEACGNGCYRYCDPAPWRSVIEDKLKGLRTFSSFL